MITVQADVRSRTEGTHYALVPSHEFSFPPALWQSREQFTQDWEHLEMDPYMADGGIYRWRRYGMFQLSAATSELTHIPGASFFQSVETNPLNGGEHRRFAPLVDATVENPFLRELVKCDFAQLTTKKDIEDDWLIGVHQIRIVASPGLVGNPTPEGIHRDDETYTAQHLIARHNIDGGSNYFYGAGPEPTPGPQAVWKQKSFFDSYYFDHSLWHSVSPIASSDRHSDGYRDVLLLDFTRSAQVD